jgi:hypothetical protein
MALSSNFRGCKSRGCPEEEILPVDIFILCSWILADLPAGLDLRLDLRVGSTAYWLSFFYLDSEELAEALCLLWVQTMSHACILSNLGPTEMHMRVCVCVIYEWEYTGMCWSDFCHCNEIPEIINLWIERIYFGLRFWMLYPMINCSCCFGPLVRWISWQVQVIEQSYSPHHQKAKESEEGPGSHYPLVGIVGVVLQFLHPGPPPKLPPSSPTPLLGYQTFHIGPWKDSPDPNSSREWCLLKFLSTDVRQN